MMNSSESIDIHFRLQISGKQKNYMKRSRECLVVVEEHCSLVLHNTYKRVFIVAVDDERMK